MCVWGGRGSGPPSHWLAFTAVHWNKRALSSPTRAGTGVLPVPAYIVAAADMDSSSKGEGLLQLGSRSVAWPQRRTPSTWGESSRITSFSQWGSWSQCARARSTLDPGPHPRSRDTRQVHDGVSRWACGVYGRAPEPTKAKDALRRGSVSTDGFLRAVGAGRPHPGA